MSRIKSITNQERKSLTDSILKMYAERHPEEEVPKITSYLNNYKELSEDMISIVDGSNGSVSTGRLRKLFYYADGNKIGTKQYSEPNFGIDFLDACYRYITNGKMDRVAYHNQLQMKSTRQNRLALTLLSFVVVSIIGIVLWTLYKPTGLERQAVQFPFEEHFDHVGLDNLRSNGWEVSEYEKSNFEKQTQKGFFTQYTVRGGYWTKPFEDSFLPNVLVYPLDEKSTSVSLSWQMFVPYQDWQGVGIVLLNEHKDFANSVSFAYSFSSTDGLILSTYQLKGHNPTGEGYISVPAGDPDDFGSHLTFRLDWQDEKIDWYVCQKKPWDPLNKKATVPLPFKPGYVGIYACQGLTDHQGQPMNADVIPVQLDWVKIE